MSGLTFVGRPQPIYFIGDSHALIFRDMLFRDAGRSELFIACVRYRPGFTAEGFTDTGGTLSEGALDALRADNLIVDNEGRWEPRHVSRQEHWGHVARAEERLWGDPVLVFSCGDLDARILAEELGGDTDFELPEGHPVDALRPDSEIVPYALILERANRSLHPLFAGLRFLHESGFQRLFLHSLAPPDPDDTRYRALGYRAPVGLRYKCTALFNRLMAEHAFGLGIHFIDLWAQTTSGGRLDVQFRLDGFHLNKEAAFLTVAAVIERLDGHP